MLSFKMFTNRLAQIWALLGFITILGYAVYRLAGHFIVAWEFSFTWYHWLLLITNVVFMAYSEGYKGFQQSYSIKFSKRLNELPKKGWWAKVLAPLFCMNYFDAEKKNLLLAYILTTAIILLIIIFNYIPQPWRGILDAGVVVGLTWGIISTILLSLKTIGRQ